MMMRNVKKSNKIFKFLGAGIIFTVLFLLVFKVYNVSYEKYQINKKITILDDAMNELNSRGDDLKALIMKLDNKDYIEKEARKKLNFQKPGEQPIIITKKSTGVNNSMTTSNKPLVAPNAKVENNAGLWFEVLFGK